MPTFIVSLNWTDQGIRAIKDGAKRAKAAREMAKRLGVEIKEIYLTTGDSISLLFSILLTATTLLNLRSRSARGEMCVHAPAEPGRRRNI